MTREIAVDDDIFEALQSRAEPLVDDVNSVLRRLLELGPASAIANGVTFMGKPAAAGGRGRRAKGRSSRSRARAAAGTLLPESEYELPILAGISERGGAAAASHVIDSVGQRLKDRLTPDDLDLLPGSGLVRWKSRTQFVRLRLTERGDMKKGSPRGIWEISSQGEARLAEAGETA